jgi:hypothetical protein
MFSFKKAYVLNDFEFEKFWEDYFEKELMHMYEEMDEAEREELERDFSKFDKWLRDSVIEMFNLYMKEVKTEVSGIVVFVDGKCHYIIAGFLFYDLCKRLGFISLVTARLGMRSRRDIGKKERVERK